MSKNCLLSLLLFITIAAFSQDVKKYLGKAYLAQNPDSSRSYFKIAKRLIKTEADEGEFLFCKSARHLDFGSPDSAIYFGNQAILKLKNGNNINSLLTVYNNLSKLYKKQGQYDKAINTLFIGIKEAEKNNKPNWVASYQSSLSLAYHDFENYPKGIFYGKKALEYYLKQQKPDLRYLYSAINAIAINYDDWNKPNEALRHHYMVFKFMKGKDTLTINSTYNNIGNTLLKIKKYKEAESWIQRAVKITDYNLKHSGDDGWYDYDQATHYTNLATIAYENSQFDQAEKYFVLAKKHSVKSKNAEKMRDYLKQFYEFSKKRKNLNETIYAQDEYIKLRDSVFNAERNSSVAEMEAKYQTEKKEKELLLAKNTILQKEEATQRKNLWLLIAGIVAGFTALIGYLFFRQQKIKNKQQEQEYELKTAIARIEAQNELHEQRLSISRDLHDNIGSQLTFVISSIENLKYGFGDSNPKILTKLEQIATFTRTTITGLRDTIWAMNTDDISFEDLKVRILNFIESARNAKDSVQFDFVVQDNLEDIKFTSLQWVNIYRSIQEAVNNAIKYAEATKILVNIESKNDKIDIQIKDNGIGFNVNDVELGHGLQNMQKRIESIQGKFTIESSKGAGTTIKFEM